MTETISSILYEGSRTEEIANTYRTFADKETVDYSEKEKKFSKTELVKKLFEAKKKLYQRMEKHLDEALDKVESLAKEPERMIT